MIGDELSVEVEEHNTFDEFAVAVMKSSNVVEHVPREICVGFFFKNLQQYHLSNNRQEKTLNCMRKRTSGSMHLHIHSKTKHLGKLIKLLKHKQD